MVGSAAALFRKVPGRSKEAARQTLYTWRAPGRRLHLPFNQGVREAVYALLAQRPWLHGENGHAIGAID